MPAHTAMWNFGKQLWKNNRELRGQSYFLIDRPLVVLHSDDWARVGVRDEEGYEALRRSGVQLGQHPYDFYTLETAGDVTALAEMLKKHKDSVGRSPCMVLNFVLANLDFSRMAARDFQEICLLYLSNGLPGHWKRPKLFDAYREGISEGLFYPALHGLTHFCRPSAEYSLLHDEKRGELLRTLWKAETSYIYWRMPWIGYEYHNPGKPNPGFLAPEVQELLIRRAADEFTKFFSRGPVSACAPGYRSNLDTSHAWAQCGVRVAQSGSGAPLPPHFNEHEILSLSRTIDIEPATRELAIEKYMQLAEHSFRRRVPLVISVHSINFHSTLKDFRTQTLHVLNEFLSALERKYPNLLYVHDEDVFNIVTRGTFVPGDSRVALNVIRQEQPARI